MLAFRGGVAGEKIKISQKFSGFEKLLLVGEIKGFRIAKKVVLYSGNRKIRVKSLVATVLGNIDKSKGRIIFDSDFYSWQLI